MNPQPDIQGGATPAIIALSVTPDEDDHLSLVRTFDCFRWTLYKADCISAALSLLHRHAVGVVLCEHDLGPGSWTDLLEELQLLRDAPPLILVSRLADEKLWAQALNLGAYDVLGL